MSIRDQLRSAQSIRIPISGSDRELVLNSDFRSFLEAASLMDQASSSSNFSDLTRASLAEEITRFHKSTGTFTEKVGLSVERLKRGAAIVRVFHQPNTMIATNISGLIN